MLRRALAGAIATALVACFLGTAAPASAYWHSGGSGAGSATSGTLAPPTAVSAGPDGPGRAAIGWSHSAGAPQPEGYHVERTGADGTHPACNSGPASLILGSSCIDDGLEAGDYTYTVIAVYRSWTARSASSPSVAVTISPLGAAAAFSVLGTAVTSTGFTRVSGDLGTTPGTAVVGFPDGVVDGTIHAGDAAAAVAEASRAAAYAELAALPADAVISGDLVGLTLGPGVYYAGAALGLTGVLTLDGGGNPQAVFVFQVAAAISTAAASSMVLVDGARAANVYWVVDAAVTAGAQSAFSGNILATGAITLGAGAELIGRALSRDAVTMAGTTVRFTVEPSPTILIDGGPAAVTKDTTPAISGTTTAAAGRQVTATVDGQTLTTAVAVDQTWSVTAAELVAGTYSVVVKVSDAAGNGATALQSLLVEVSPPTIALGLAAPFSVLAGTTITATGVSHVDGDAGVSPGTSISGLPPASVGGATHAGDAAAGDALAALVAAIDDGSSRQPHTEFAGDLVGRVFHAGVHHSAAALTLTGTLTLDGEGDPGAVFVFQVDAAMGTAASSSVLLVNGAQASNVFWVVDGAVDTGALASLPGTILATGAITLGAGTALTGRALTLDAVVMADTAVTAPQ